MNATSLYVSTCRLILQSETEDSKSWTDLFRLFPYLRQSLSCTVCGNLLIEPYTPTETSCQHHVCKSCKGCKKKLKPSCSWCKDYDKYVENVQLRILLQCYKKLCQYVTSTSILKRIANTCAPSINTNTNLLDGTSPTLINLIQEGAGFADEFRTSASSRSAKFVLPCVNTNTTSTQTNSATTSSLTLDESSTLPYSNGETETVNSQKPMQNGSSMYSVLYDGSGSKLTFKRKASEAVCDSNDSSNKKSIVSPVLPPPSRNISQLHTPKARAVSPSKKQCRSGKSNSSTGNLKTGCKCGNASQSGKLTCCGQRCACYIESKPCNDCKCKGCRNPHTADGQKVCPVIPSFQLQLPDDSSHLPTPQCFTLGANDMATASGGTVQVVGLYTTQLHNVSPGSLLLDANTAIVTCGLNSEDGIGDVNVDL